MKNLIYLYALRIKPPLLLASMLLVILLNNCGGKSIPETHIPADVDLVIRMKLSKLGEKALDSKNLWNSLFSSSIEWAPLKELIALYRVSGIDIEKTAHIFGKYNDDEEPLYLASIVKIADVSRFKKYVEDWKEEAKLIKEGKRSLYLGKNTALSWNEEEALYIWQPETETNSEKIKATLDNILAGAKEEALEANNKEFVKIALEKHDLSLWMNYEKVSKGFLSFLPANLLSSEMSSLNDFTKSIALGVNFKAGEVKIHTETYVSEKASEKYTSLIQASLTSETVKASPHESPGLFLAFAVGSESIPAFLKDQGVDHEMNLLLDYMDMKSKDFWGILSGEVVMALDTAAVEQYLYRGSIGFGVHNSKHLDRVLKRMSGLPFMKNKGDYYRIRTELGQYYLIRKEKHLFLATTKKLRDRLIESKGSQNPDLFGWEEDTLSLFSLDIEQLKSLLANLLALSPPELARFVDLMERVESRTQSYEGNRSDSDTILFLKDKKRNSLAVFLDFILQNAPKKSAS